MVRLRRRLVVDDDGNRHRRGRGSDAQHLALAVVLRDVEIFRGERLERRLRLRVERGDVEDTLGGLRQQSRRQGDDGQACNQGSREDVCHGVVAEPGRSGAADRSIEPCREGLGFEGPAAGRGLAPSREELRVKRCRAVRNASHPDSPESGSLP